MGKKTTTKSRKNTSKNKFLRFFKKRPFASAVIFAVVLASGLLGGVWSVNAQNPVPIVTFKGTYKAYKPGLANKAGYTAAQKCADSKTIYGAKPAAVGNYPVLIYVHGTFGDWGGNTEGQSFVKHAAAQGFTAIAFTYDSAVTNSTSGYQGHTYCMFDQAHTGSGLTAACAFVGADCSKGVTVSGFSQGAVISVMSKNFAPSVKAVWALGISSDIVLPSKTITPNLIAAPAGTRALPNDKLVVNMGQASNDWTKDLEAGELASLKTLTGADCGTAYQCLNPTDGSGFYIVLNSQVKDKVADHCYWEGVSGCTLWPKTLDPGFIPPSTNDWSMIRNLDWLKKQY